MRSNQFRHACEECHERKIRCKQKGTESGCCEACQANGRHCLFSLKLKTGRPQKRKAPSAFSTNSFPTNSVSGRFSISETSPSNVSSHSTVDSIPWLIHTEFDDLFRYSPLQDASFWEPQPGHDREDEKYCIASHELGMRTTGDSICERSLREEQATHAATGELILPSFGGTQPRNNTTEYTESSVETYERDVSELVSPDIEEQEARSTLKHVLQSEATKPANGRATAKVTDFLKVLELSHELRVSLENVELNEASLLVDRDMPKVRRLLDALEKLCDTIGIMIGISCADITALDGSTNVFVLATIMDTISQIIRRLHSWTELGPRSRFRLRYNALPTALDVTTEPTYFGFEDKMFGLVEAGSGAPPPPDLQIEQVISLTRFDFYLLRLKSYITHFDAESELLAATSSLFSTNDLKASLLALHNRVDNILFAWRRQWSE